MKCDETYPKAYYRMGQANVAMAHFDQACKDFKQVCKLLPQDRDAREKYEATLKEHKYRELAKCIGYDDKKVVIDVKDIVVEQSYAGPRLDNGVDELDGAWVASMMEFLKGGKVLHKKYAVMIISRARELFEKDTSLVHINVPEDKEITVCGDIHGQFYDLLNIF